MATSDLKKRVLEYVQEADEPLLQLMETVAQNYNKEADERLLNVLKAVVDSYKENEVVAYAVDGQPLNRKQYRQELVDAEAEIARGASISQEDLERESEGW